MKRLIITMAAVLIAASCLWAKDDEVIVTRQLTMSQRGSLPDKTNVVEMKCLTPAKHADTELLDAIGQVMDTIAREDYMNRTFVLLLEPKADGQMAIGARSDDIVTRGKQDPGIYYGTLEHGRYHFVVLTSKENLPLLERTFKRQSKVKFVQEFEFVDFPTPHYPTNVIAQWSPGQALRWLTVVINEDPNRDRESFDTPARMEE